MLQLEGMGVYFRSGQSFQAAFPQRWLFPSALWLRAPGASGAFLLCKGVPGLGAPQLQLCLYWGKAAGGPARPWCRHQWCPCSGHGCAFIPKIPAGDGMEQHKNSAVLRRTAPWHRVQLWQGPAAAPGLDVGSLSCLCDFFFFSWRLLRALEESI